MRAVRLASVRLGLLVGLVAGCPAPADPPKDRDPPTDTDTDTDTTEPVLAWADRDGDGYGDPESPVDAADLGVDNDDDCDDTDPAVHPDAGEDCGPADEDCDELLNDDDPDLADAPVWYADPDGDGLGDPSDTVEACEAPPGYVPTIDCPGSGRPLDWVDGVDQDGDGVDVMVSAAGDGWSAADHADPFYYPTDLGPSSVSLDVERDGMADLFLVGTTVVWDLYEPGPIDGVFRVDDVRCDPTGDLWAQPHLRLPGVVRVDLWEDTTGDGVPEIVIAAQTWEEFPYYEFDHTPGALDLFLVDPTTTGASADVADIAIAHLNLAQASPGPVADFDGDGHPEVVYSDLDRQALVFLGTWPAFGDPVVADAEVALASPLTWAGFTVGDPNADGAADLGVSALGRLIYGGPDLGAAPIDQAVKVEGNGLYMVDVDGDGVDDVLTYGWDYLPPLPIWVRLGGPGGIGVEPDLVYELSAATRKVRVGDVDGDGRADLLLVDPQPEGVAYTWAELRLAADDYASAALRLKYDPATTWTPTGSTDVLPDVDLDGRADLAVRNLRGAEITWIDWLYGAPRP